MEPVQAEEAGNRIHWVGLDVSKATFDAAWLSCAEAAPSKNLSRLPSRSFPRTASGAEEFVKWVDEHLERGGLRDYPVRCVMEATGRYSQDLVFLLCEVRASLMPAIVPPRETSQFIQSLGVRNVTDKLASRGLAVYGRERAPEAYVPMSPAEAELRAVSRYRDSLMRQRIALGNQAQEGTSSEWVKQQRDEHLSSLKAAIKSAEAELRRLVEANQNLKEDVALLRSIYGVGFITAAVIRAELGDLRRFDGARELSAFAGVNPSNKESGTSVRTRTRMSKQGNARVRQALYLSAMVLIRKPSDLQSTYKRLIQQGKSKMAALGAVMRKMLVMMRAILIHNTPYEANRMNGGQLVAGTP